MIHKKGKTFYNKNGDVMKCHIVGTMNDNGQILVIYKYFGTHKRWWHYVIEEVESFNNYFKVGLYSTKNLWKKQKGKSTV